MRSYLDLLAKTLDEGVKKINERTGMGTLSLFGESLQFNLQEGFPLVTTSNKAIGWITEELLMFLQGVTNNNYLTDRGVSIWNEWALKEPLTRKQPYNDRQRLEAYAEHIGKSAKDVEQSFLDGYNAKRGSGAFGSYELLKYGHGVMDAAEFPSTYDVVELQAGELGPIYGALWRSWPNPDGTYTDQIAELLQNLETAPYSRRHVISAWNPSVLPDESISPQENVKLGKQSLAACHTLFQFVVQPMTLDQRMTAYLKDTTEEVRALLPINAHYEQLLTVLRSDTGTAEEITQMQAEIAAALDIASVPKDRINLMLHQRSADGPLGVPYNIASYAILLHLIAQQFNFLPWELKLNFGDFHIYTNQIEGVREQLKREPLGNCRLLINPAVKHLLTFSKSDIKIAPGSYKSHPQINYGDIAV